MRDIKAMLPEEIAAALAEMGQPKYRAKQIFHWVHQKQAAEFSQMTDQPKALIARLEQDFYIAQHKVRRCQRSKDGTVKYLFELADGNCIETVLMRYNYGNTVCVHAGGLPDGLPLLRIHTGRPCAQSGSRRDRSRNLRRYARYRRACFSCGADGHRRAAG